MKLSLGFTQYDTHPFQWEVEDFSEFAELLQQMESPAKGQYYICSGLSPDDTGVIRRWMDRTLPREWLAFDVDYVTRAVAADLFRDMKGHECIIYTTASSTLEAPRMRLILLADREMSFEEGIRVSRGIQSQLIETYGVDNIRLDESVYQAHQPVFTPTKGCHFRRYSGKIVCVEEWLAKVPPLPVDNESKLERAAKEAKKDRVFQTLLERNMVQRELEAGKFAITCPFEEGHSKPTGASSSIYFLPNFGGYLYGRFDCKHEHCGEKTQDDFQRALGLDPNELWHAAKAGRLVLESGHKDLFLNLYHEGLPPGLSTGWEGVDNYYKARRGDFTVITGAPGSGKSAWVNALAVNLASQHGWRFGVFSPEMMPVSQLQSFYAELYLGKPFDKGPTQRMTEEEAQEAFEWVTQHFHIMHAPDDAPTVDEVLKTAKQLVDDHAINGLIIDPWNELSHPFGSKSETIYCNEQLRNLRTFARENQVAIWLVAHPIKLRKKDSGEYPIPSPWDIAGSNAFFNKPDVCLTVHREPSTDDVRLLIQKVKFRQIGKLGDTAMSMDRATGRYSDKPQEGSYASKKGRVTSDYRGGKRTRPKPSESSTDPFDDEEPF